MADDKNKPTKLTHDMQIDIQTLAAALRLATDPVENMKVQRVQEVDGKPQVRIKAVSPTGARFTLVLEEMRNKRTRALEVCIKTLEDYEYPWSPELEEVASSYTPPLKFWKNPDMVYDWGTSYDERGVAHRKPLDQIVNPVTKQLNTTSKQKLYDDTWKADLREFGGLTVAQGSIQGLREVKKTG